MDNFLNGLKIGLVLLSPDLRIIGMNDFARGVFVPAPEELGKSLLSYHHGKSRERVRSIMREMIATPVGGAKTVVIDVLGKAIMNNLSELTIESPAVQTCWALTFIDVTSQTGAEKNPLSGMVEMKKIPVAVGGSYRFIPLDDVYAIQSDGDYCRIFTSAGTYYLHLNLKTIQIRYPSQALFRVHKSYVVNCRRIRETFRTGNNQLMVVLDHGDIPPIPVSRRRSADLKRALVLK